MTEKSRSQNAKRNIVFGYIAQIGIFILSFIGRKIFLLYLSADYLGINGLYTNILTVLSLAEMGIDSAFVFSLYKPVAERNYDLVNSILSFFRKLYFLIATCLFVIGLAVIPFLKYLIDSDISQGDLIFYYVVFLFNMVVTYFVAHKIALFAAFQEQRFHKMFMLLSNFILQILQIIILIVFGDYRFYVLSSTLIAVIHNIVISIAAERMYPEVFNARNDVLINKQEIFKRIRATFLYKLGAVLINSTDNILISALVGITFVGLYSNYLSVISTFTSLIAIINTALISGIGNLAVKAGKDNQESLFNMMILIYHLIAALGLIGFSLLFNDLITVWLGAKYLLDYGTVFIIALNFYLTYAIAPIWIFREANGLFGEVKYILLIRAAINIVLSIILGKLFGIFGVLLATTISHILTNIWYEPLVLSKKVLHGITKSYWKKQLRFFLLTVLCYMLCFFVTSFLGSGVVNLILEALVVCSITIFVFYITNFKTPEYIKLRQYFIKK